MKKIFILSIIIILNSFVETRALLPPVKCFTFIGSDADLSLDNVYNLKIDKRAYVPEQNMSLRNNINYGFGISYTLYKLHMLPIYQMTVSLGYNNLKLSNIGNMSLIANAGNGDTVVIQSTTLTELELKKINFSFTIDYKLSKYNLFISTAPIISYIIKSDINNSITSTSGNGSLTYFDSPEINLDKTKQEIKMLIGKISEGNKFQFGWLLGLKYIIEVNNFLYRCHGPEYQGIGCDPDEYYHDASSHLLISPSINFNYNFINIVYSQIILSAIPSYFRKFFAFIFPN